MGTTGMRVRIESKVESVGSTNFLVGAQHRDGWDRWRFYTHNSVSIFLVLGSGAGGDREAIKL